MLYFGYFTDSGMIVCQLIKTYVIMEAGDMMFRGWVYLIGRLLQQGGRLPAT